MLWNAYLPAGRYRNPILYADYADPDVIRVGEDYYMAASSFSNAPGLPILHSRDLVGWQVIHYVVPRIPFLDYDRPAHGRGVWAPALRFHDGLFWVFFAMPDEGIFFCTTKNPALPWSEPVCLCPERGWIDPCPFWDDDGRAYLVHGFAKSRSGKKSLLQLWEMTPDARALLGEPSIIFDGHNTQPTIEGPKLYRRGDWYYIFAPAGGVPNGWQTVLRARAPQGPYEEKIVMMRGDSAVNGPHQGGWVNTPSGEDWFLHFQDVGYCGRIVHLQPMCWKNDWPVIGEDRDDEGWGTPVAEAAMPCTGHAATHTEPAADDDFSAAELGLQWQWNANPRPAWYALPGDGLHLAAQPLPEKLCDAPHLLLQKFPRADFTMTAQCDIAQLAPGAGCALVVLSRAYGALLLQRTSAGMRLAFYSGRITQGAQTETEIGALPTTAAQLCLQVDDYGICRFCYRLSADDAWVQAAQITAEPGVWTGAKLGFVCSGAPGTGSAILRDVAFAAPQAE